MFSEAQASYKARQADLTRAAAEAEQAAVHTLDRVLHGIVAKTNAGSAQAYRQQQEIGRQLKAARKSVQQLKGQAAALADSAERLEQTALTFGDLENYLAVITAEVGSVAVALQRVRRQQAAQQEAETRRRQLPEQQEGGQQQQRQQPARPPVARQLVL